MVEAEDKPKQRKDIVPDQFKERIQEFFLSPVVSREVPDKREAIKIKDKKTSKVMVVQRHCMSMSIQDAHTVYKELHPEYKIGLISFSKLRPIQVKTVTETNRRTCLCQQCCNAALKGLSPGFCSIFVITVLIIQLVTFHAFTARG